MHDRLYVLANPQFNDSDWFRKDDDVRFFSLSASNGERAGVRCRNDGPPKGNANFAWVQYFKRTVSSTLATLRDTLLPKVLSGELSVAETQ